MKEYLLKLHLLSDTTLGRGSGKAGLVDVEVQHDAAGLPYMSGRTLKGLLSAECDDLVYALESKMGGRWHIAYKALFGKRGATLTGEALMRVGPARLPQDLHEALLDQIREERKHKYENPLTRAGVLDTFTTLRRQTAMDETGAPRKETLRTLRVILRDTTFSARLTFIDDPSPDALALLAATVKALRRVGTGRNRGRGRVEATLHDAQGELVTETLFAEFRKAVVV